MKYTSCIALGNVTKHSFMDLIRKLLMFRELLAAWQHPHRGFVCQPTAAHDPQACVRTLPRAAGSAEPHWHLSCVTDTITWHVHTRSGCDGEWITLQARGRTEGRKAIPVWSREGRGVLRIPCCIAQPLTKPCTEPCLQLNSDTLADTQTVQKQDWPVSVTAARRDFQLHPKHTFAIFYICFTKGNSPGAYPMVGQRHLYSTQVFHRSLL